MTWYYNGSPVDSPPENIVGFVYLVTDLDTGMMYVGKKNFYSTRKLPPLKGKKRKRTKVVESDWQKYYGSNDLLKEKVAQNPPEKFKREILHMCSSKGMMNYLELKEQVERDVLFDDLYYNSFIGVKIHASHVKGP